MQGTTKTNISYTMDYWALIALSTLFCHLMASPARDLTPLMLLEDIDNMPVEREKRASVVMCSTEHSFYCINTTHYSRCMDMEVMKSLKMQKVVFCGAGLCCQVGSVNPCGVKCPKPRTTAVKDTKKRSQSKPWRRTTAVEKKRQFKYKIFLMGDKSPTVDENMATEDYVYEDADHLITKPNALGTPWRPSYRKTCQFMPLTPVQSAIALSTVSRKFPDINGRRNTHLNPLSTSFMHYVSSNGNALPEQNNNTSSFIVNPSPTTVNRDKLATSTSHAESKEDGVINKVWSGSTTERRKENEYYSEDGNFNMIPDDYDDTVSNNRPDQPNQHSSSLKRASSTERHYEIGGEAATGVSEKSIIGLPGRRTQMQDDTGVTEENHNTAAVSGASPSSKPLLRFPTIQSIKDILKEEDDLNEDDYNSVIDPFRDSKVNNAFQFYDRKNSEVPIQEKYIEIPKITAILETSISVPEESTSDLFTKAHTTQPTNDVNAESIFTPIYTAYQNKQSNVQTESSTSIIFTTEFINGRRLQPRVIESQPLPVEEESESELKWMCTSTGNFRYRLSCVRYIRCSIRHGRFLFEMRRCPMDLEFDSRKQTCVPLGMSDCRPSSLSEEDTLQLLDTFDDTDVMY